MVLSPRTRRRPAGLASAALALTLAGCGSPVSVPSPAPDVVPAEHGAEAEVLRAFRDASNAHDVDAVLALCAPDVVWERGSAPELVGHEAVREPFAFDAATRASFEIGAVTFDGEQVCCVLAESNDLYRALGIDSARERVEFTIRDGRIHAIASLPSPEPTEEQLTVGRFLAWLSREHPADAELVLGPGGPQAEHAAQLVERAREWAGTR